MGQTGEQINHKEKKEIGGGDIWLKTYIKFFFKWAKWKYNV